MTVPPWKHWLERYEGWWFRPTTPHALAIARIAIGIFLLIYASIYLPYTVELLSAEGIVLPRYAFALPENVQWILAAPPPFIAITIASIFLAAVVCMTIGFMTRPALIVTTILAWYEWQLAVHLFPTSYHRLVLFTLIILCFSNSDRTYSLRMKLTQGSFCAWEPISIFPQRLIALQLTAIYLGAALQKFWLPGWQGGEILSYMLIGNWATPLAYWIARLPLTIAVFDASVWIVKFFLFVLPFGLWIPKLRTASFIGGALFHLCITLLLGPWGFLVMIPLYACFVPGDLRSVQAPQLSK